MSQSEIPLQVDMFTGVLRDTRTDTQKHDAAQRSQPQSTLMFPQREIAQFGVRARPQMSLSPHTKLRLVSEDPRTEEEIERDRQREAERLTKPLFASEKETVYLHLVAAAEVAGRAVREEGDANGGERTELTTFAHARSEAEQAKLTEAEIQLAIIIGLYRSKSNAENIDGVHNTSSIEPPPLPDVVEEPIEPVDDAPMLRLVIYLRLVHLGETDPERVEEYPLGFLTHVGLTVLDAQSYGLQREEIQAALQIGTYRRRRDHYPIAPSQTSQNITPTDSTPIFAAPCLLGEGKYLPIPIPSIF
jgi:hypothetical protein